MKQETLLPYSESEARTPSSFKRKAITATHWLSIGACALYAGSRYFQETPQVPVNACSACFGGAKLVPKPDPKYSELAYFRTPEFRNQSLSVWQGAVKIYTPSFDDFGEVGEDPRWDVFYEYEQYLKDSFPLIVKNSELIHANTHGLNFIIHGSDESLKPVLLMGHQDVVPVPPENVDRWTHDPFSGYFDGRWLWGPGAGDDKDAHIAIMEAVEKLLSEGWQPTRTVILSFGCDEESGGKFGAQYNSLALQERYGPDSIYFLLDEGDVMQDWYGTHFAPVNVGEKGNMEVDIDLVTSGGHSSIPPEHTSIGIMAELITLLEADPYKLALTEKNPFFQEIQCLASNGRDFPEDLREDVLSMDKSKESMAKVLAALEKELPLKFRATTSQAITVVHGGMKINALPEKVSIKIDHRVGYETSMEDIKAKILSKVEILANKYHLGIEAFGEVKAQDSDYPVKIPVGKFVLATADPLSHAPRSPSSGPQWDVIAGTIKHIFEDFALFPESDPDVGDEVSVMPSINTGNTDTRYFWPLTKNIYRFSPSKTPQILNCHTIDERVDLNSHVEDVAFFYTLLRNVEEQDTL